MIKNKDLRTVCINSPINRKREVILALRALVERESHRRPRLQSQVPLIVE
jgi:hypothetical protein